MRRRTICAPVVCWACDLGALQPRPGLVERQSDPVRLSLASSVRRAGHHAVLGPAGAAVGRGV